jgi:hypothetical protein
VTGLPEPAGMSAAVEVAARTGSNHEGEADWGGRTVADDVEDIFGALKEAETTEFAEPVDDSFAAVTGTDVLISVTTVV